LAHLFEETLVLLCFWGGEGDKNGIDFVGTVGMFIVVILRVQILALEESA
jgi:hypothetical protein